MQNNYWPSARQMPKEVAETLYIKDGFLCNNDE